jgi:hypothetical protein
MKLSAVSATVVTIIVSLAFLQTSCSGQMKPTPIEQYIPAGYYNCSVTTPADLCRAYFGRYHNISAAQAEFDNQIFVFKNVVITGDELKYATDDYLWLDNIIQCYFLTSGNLQRLKAGDEVDVVGVDAGLSKDYKNLLVFTGCIFLPAGSVQIPAPGSSSLVIPPY